MRTAPLLLALSLGTAAQAGTIEAPILERVDDGTAVVRWRDADPVDVFIVDRADARPAEARLVSPGDGDGRHELALPTSPRAYVLLRDTRSGKTAVVGERVLPLAQGSNFRDLGGYRTMDGGHLRWGRIFRSGATPLLTDGDLAEIRSLGLASMIDLRSSEERVFAPTKIEGVPYSAIGYSMTAMMPMDPAKQSMNTLYGEMPAFLAPQLRLVFAELLRGEGPIAYNCSAGQDRTGFVTAMILTALGVPHDTIVQDYHLSTSARRMAFETPRLDPATVGDNPVAQMFARGQDQRATAKPRPLLNPDGSPFLSQSFIAIEKNWGSVDAYLEKKVGVGKAEIRRLKAIYVE